MFTAQPLFFRKFRFGYNEPRIVSVKDFRIDTDYATLFISSPWAIWKLHQVGGELQQHANSALCVGAGEHVAEAALVDD